MRFPEGGILGATWMSVNRVFGVGGEAEGVGDPLA